MEELSGADVVDQLPAATSSAAGKATAAQIAKLDGITAGADATSFRGNVTDTQMLALPSPVAGQWVHNTDYGYAKYVYNGTFWLGPTDFVLTNKTGATSVLSKTCKVSSAQVLLMAGALLSHFLASRAKR